MVTQRERDKATLRSRNTFQEQNIPRNKDQNEKENVPGIPDNKNKATLKMKKKV